MPSGSLYQKFGTKAPDPAAGLMAGQQAMNQITTSLFDSVNSLLERQQAKYTEQNTLALEQSIKNSLSQQGLGAAPLDIASIKQEYGSLADTDRLLAADTAQREELLTSTENAASKAALATFAETKDIDKTRTAYVEIFNKANADASVTSAKANTFLQDNKHLEKQIEQQKALTQDKLLNEGMEAVQSGLFSVNEYVDAVGVSKELDASGMKNLRQSLKQDVQAASALTDEQKAGHALARQEMVAQKTLALQKAQELIDQEEATLGANPVMSTGVTNLVNRITGTTGGLPAEMGASVDQGTWAGIKNGIAHMFSDKLMGDKAASLAMEELTLQMKTHSPQEAMGIVVAGLQQSLADGTLAENAFLDATKAYSDKLSTYKTGLSAVNKRKRKLETLGAEWDLKIAQRQRTNLNENAQANLRGEAYSPTTTAFNFASDGPGASVKKPVPKKSPQKGDDAASLRQKGKELVPPPPPAIQKIPPVQEEQLGNNAWRNLKILARPLVKQFQDFAANKVEEQLRERGQAFALPIAENTPAVQGKPSSAVEFDALERALQQQHPQRVPITSVPFDFSRMQIGGNTPAQLAARLKQTASPQQQAEALAVIEQTNPEIAAQIRLYLLRG